MRLSFKQFLVLFLLACLSAALLAFSGLDIGDLIATIEGTASAPSKPSTSTTFDFPVTWARVDAVLDGDTIRLRDGERVRYIGIDTPETTTSPDECFAQQASKRNRQLVNGKRIALRKDRSETDRYGRLLRYVYLEDGRMVNDILVAEGYAIAVEYRPDTLFTEHFAALAETARSAGKGLWGACSLP